MASEDLKTKKRKGAADASPKPKKQKKSDAAAAAAKQSAKALKSAVDPLDAVPTKVPAKANRARAQDFFDPEVASKDETAKEKKNKKKNQAVKQADGDNEVEAPKVAAVEVQEKPKKGKKVAATVVDIAPVVETSSETTKKAKKGNKGKSSLDLDHVSSAIAVEATSAPAAIEALEDVAKPKSKKAKKAKAQVEAEDAPVKESKVALPEAQPVAEVSHEALPTKAKRGKKGKAAENAKPDAVETAPVGADAPAVSASEVKKSRKERTSKKAKPADPEPEVDAGVDVEDDDEQEDDQTAALLAGFDSENDEVDAEDKEFDKSAKPMIPGELRDDLNKVARQKNGKRGVVFIGRLPHGFFEPQLKAYFAQFGTVTRLRLSRNKKTGASKHYAFIEFASDGVADIVAKTMDKYLLFGHILQCKTIPEEQVHADLFKGSNARFKVMPRNQIAGAEMKRGAERAVWEKRVDKETTKRARLNAKLKEKMGYEFTAPQLKTVEDIPMKDAAHDDGPEQQLLAEEADSQGRPHTIVEVTHTEEETPGSLSVTETVKTRKSKKDSRLKAVPAPENVEPAVVLPVEAAPVKEKKTKKEKKAKAEPVVEPADEKTELGEAGEVKKGKKAKKATPVEVAVEEAIKDKKRKAKPVEHEAAVESKPKKAKKAKASAA